MCKLTLPDIYHGIQQGRFAVSAMERLNARSSSQCQCEKKKLVDFTFGTTLSALARYAVEKITT